MNSPNQSDVQYKITLLADQVEFLKECVGYNLPKFIQPIVDDNETSDVLLDMKDTLDSLLDMYGLNVENVS